MKTIINNYKGYGVLHTINKVEQYQRGFNLAEFTQYQEGKKADYRMLTKYFEQCHKGVKVNQGKYGVELTIKKGDMTGVVVLSYCQDVIISMEQTNVLNKYIDRSINEFNNDDWMVEVTDEQLEEVIDLHFNMSNYIKKYKTLTWVTLLVKVVEEHDFYEEFIQGMDKYTKIKLMWDYTSTGLTVYHEDDRFQIDDSHIILQEDRLAVIEQFFQYITYIKSKCYQAGVTGEVKQGTYEDGGSEQLEDTITQTQNNGEHLLDEGDTLSDEDIVESVELQEDYTIEGELTEQKLEELQTQQEVEYLNNLKKGKIPEFQTIKINDEESYLHPIQGTSYLSKLRGGIPTSIIVYKDGKEVVNTLKGTGWSNQFQAHIDGIIKGIEFVIAKYGYTKVDLVFNRDISDVTVRITIGEQEDEICIVQTKQRQVELGKKDDEVINLDGVGDPTKHITDWFKNKTGW